VAERLGLRYLDTGSMYRALTWQVLERGLDPTDEDQVVRLAREVRLDVGMDPACPTVTVDGVDVTSAVRETRISAAVSAVATNLQVRAELVRRQKALVAPGGVVAEGRDITTVVAPDAPVRVLLTASARARVARRARDVHGHADDSALAATLDQVLRRDSDDSSVAEFHEPATGVIVLDSSALTFEETVEAVLGLVAVHTSESVR
jgi:cytidylate kinase